VHVRALHASGVSGTISYREAGKGTEVWVRLRGAPPRVTVRVLLETGTCVHHSASFALAANGTATAAGRFADHGRILFHRLPVSGIADGTHLFVVTSGGGESACARIPGIS
jgi:hypothetical protein